MTIQIFRHILQGKSRLLASSIFLLVLSAYNLIITGLSGLPVYPAVAEAQSVSCDISWNVDTDGSWHTPSNWNLGRVPGADDNVCINRPKGNFTITYSTGTTSINSLQSEEALLLSGGILSIAATSEINNSFALSGGTLSGAGELTINSSMTWTGGGMGGTGTTSIAPGAILTLSGGNNKFLDVRTLTNNGAMTWTGTGSLFLTNTSLINNQTGALFEMQTDAGLFYNGGVFPTFTNAGTFRKAAGTGSTRLGSGVVFNHSGTVEVQTGTLSIEGGGASASHFDLASGATLLFVNNYTLNAGATLTGAGLARLTGGTLTIAGDVSSQRFELAGGSLTGTGTLNVTSNMNWTGGSMSGTGTTTIAPGATLTLSGGNNKFLDVRTLTNGGTLTWTGTGSLFLTNASLINNQMGGSSRHKMMLGSFIMVGPFPPSLTRGSSASL